MTLHEVYNPNTLDSSIWPLSLYWCFVKEFFWSFVIYVTLIIAFCVFVDMVYYSSYAASYWKTHDIRSKLTNDDYSLLMKCSSETNGASLNIGSVIASKAVDEKIRKLIPGFIAKKFNDMADSLNDNKSAKLMLSGASSPLLIDNGSVGRIFDKSQLDFKSTDDVLEYIRNLIKLFACIIGADISSKNLSKSKDLYDVINDLIPKSSFFPELEGMMGSIIEIVKLLKKDDFNDYYKEKYDDEMKKFQTEKDGIMNDTIMWEWQKRDKLDALEQRKSELGTEEFYINHQKNLLTLVFVKLLIDFFDNPDIKDKTAFYDLLKTIIDNLRLSSFIEIIADLLRKNGIIGDLGESNIVALYFDAKMFGGALWNAGANSGFLNLCTKIEGYITQNNLRSVDLSKLDDVNKIVEKHSPKFIKTSKYDQQYTCDLFREILLNGHDIGALLGPKDEALKKCDELSKTKPDSILIKGLRNYHDVDAGEARKKYRDITEFNDKIDFRQRKLYIEFIGRLHDIYYNELYSVNPFRRWVLNKFLYGKGMVSENDENDNQKYKKLQNIPVVDDKFKDKYLFIKLIVDGSDEHHGDYFKLLGVVFAVQFGWWILMEVGFRLMSSIQDFNKIALNLSPLFNANIEYVNRNLFLDFAKYICDFHHIVFAITLFVFWLIFSIYSYINYFNILFKTTENLIIHLFVLSIFIVLMFFQKDVVIISTEEMMIDYSEKHHVVVGSLNNVMSYYNSGLQRSKYNKWAIWVFVLFFISYLIYALSNVDLVKVVELYGVYLHWQMTYRISLLNELSTSIRGIFVGDDELRDILKKSFDKLFIGTNMSDDAINDIVHEAVKLIKEFKGLAMLIEIVSKLLTFIFMLYMSYILYSSGASFKFFITDYADLLFIFNSPEDMENMRSVENIDSMSLKIDEFSIFNIDDKQLSSKQRFFVMKFKDAMFAGDKAEMNKLLSECEYNDLRTMIKDKLNDPKNLLIKNVDVKFKGNELEIIEDGWKYKMNANIVELNGASGSGKSTIQNMLIGKRKYVGANINNILTYYMEPSSRYLLPSFSSSYSNYLKTVSVFENLTNANVDFDRNTSVFKDIGIDKYSDQLDYNYSDIFMSMGQRCRMDFVYFFTQLNANINKGRKGFLSFMDEPFGALDPTSVDLTWSVMDGYIRKYDLLFFIVDHSGFAASKADLRMMIQDKTLKFYVDTDATIQLKDLEFDDSGVATYNGRKIRRQAIGKNNANDDNKIRRIVMLNDKPKEDQVKLSMIKNKTQQVEVLVESV